MERLWLKYSDGKFGYSVQRKIWRTTAIKGDFEKFCRKIDWNRWVDEVVGGRVGGDGQRGWSGVGGWASEAWRVVSAWPGRGRGRGREG